MADVFSPEKRSQVMSRIRSRGNKDTELALIKLLRQHGITGWRRHQAMVGRPDFVFRKQQVVVFVDGCFWHGCPKHCKMPSGNASFWEKKLNANVKRDRRVTRYLRRDRWSVIRIWEHDLRARPGRCIRRIASQLADVGDRVRDLPLSGWTRRKA